MINKSNIKAARATFKEETTKLINELIKKNNKTVAPSSPISPKDIAPKKAEFRSLVEKRIAEFSANQEYLKYLGTAQEDTITA